MTWLYVSGYVLSGLVSVPLIARSVYDPDDGRGQGLFASRAGCIGVAIPNAVLWPFWAVIGLIVLASHALVSLVFRDPAKPPAREREQ